ncbi:MAG: DUF4957 domain-containing protein [Reichenbachiella sp.]
MNKIIALLVIVITILSCEEQKGISGIKVSNFSELEDAVKNAVPGSNIVMANGVWKDAQIKLRVKGTKEKPITIQAETPGKVFIEGESYLKFGGEYIIVSGLYFRNGYTPSNAVIDFKVSKNEIANNCRITNTVIEGFNQMSRDRKDHWVEFWGKYNQMDHCYLAGKSNEGPTVRVEIKGNQNIRNYHQITDNHFGPRPRKGGPKAETIQLGDSFSSMSPSNTLVANNLFEECNGEVEVISSKTNFNEFRNNVFFKSEGSLVTRHGNYCIIDGNYFIGDESNENIGGIRIINTGHRVTNNYFYNLKGKSFRSPLAVMNGIPKSPLNRYNQVTDVVVAFNTWINCPSPWQFGVGTNISQKEVLPLSEIRSARPVRTEVTNNLIYNSIGDPSPIVEHDKADGVMFKSNAINNQNVEFGGREGLKKSNFELKEIADNIMVPIQPIEGVEVYKGYEYDAISMDIFGKSRNGEQSIGAIAPGTATDPKILNRSKYGTNWYVSDKKEKEGTLASVKSSLELEEKLSEASAGDVIELDPGYFSISKSLVINKQIIIRSKDAKNKATISYDGPKGSAAFEMNPKGYLTLQDIILKGTGSQMAFASLKNNMSSHYMLNVFGCEISNFEYVLKAYKQSFAEEITFSKSTFKNCENGIDLSEETNDKGDYNVEFLTIDQCEFENIKQNVIDYYRGGYDESTIGGNLMVSNSSFTRSGGQESSGILINTRGIVNVEIKGNTFKNNGVNLVALLWGAKNNSHSDNSVMNSGSFLVQENLKLKLVY